MINLCFSLSVVEEREQAHQLLSYDINCDAAAANTSIFGGFLHSSIFLTCINCKLHQIYLQKLHIYHKICIYITRFQILLPTTATTAFMQSYRQSRNCLFALSYSFLFTSLRPKEKSLRSKKYLVKSSSLVNVMSEERGVRYQLLPWVDGIAFDSIAFEIRIWITMELLLYSYLDYGYLDKVLFELVFVFEFLRS